MRFRDALALIFCWLPMRCPFTVLALVDFTTGGADAGNGVGGGTYLWAAGTDWLLLSATGCWLLCVVAVLSLGGGSATSLMAGIGVFCLVCCWWMRGVVRRTLGSVGLLDDVMPVSNLWAAAAFTLCGGALSTLGIRVLSTLCRGLSNMID